MQTLLADVLTVHTPAVLAIGTAAIIGLGLVALAVVAAVLGIGIYNRLTELRERYLNSFSQIDVQLQRRYDLIPNLVETVKGAMAHERETLEAVISARNVASAGLAAAKANPGDPKAMQQLAQADAQLTGVLGRLLAVAEAYPQLRANESMQHLQEELSSTENRVSFARQSYNDGAQVYNEYRKTFPPVLFASLLGHKRDAEYLQLENPEAKVAPKVSFGKTQS